MSQDEPEGKRPDMERLDRFSIDRTGTGGFGITLGMTPGPEAAEPARPATEP